LALDVVSIPKPTEFFLARSIPDIEADGSKVGCELQGVDLNAERGDILLFEFPSQMALDESGLSSTTITDYNRKVQIVSSTQVLCEFLQKFWARQREIEHR